jgi:hypothetical protein
MVTIYMGLVGYPLKLRVVVVSSWLIYPEVAFGYGYPSEPVSEIASDSKGKAFQIGRVTN